MPSPSARSAAVAEAVKEHLRVPIDGVADARDAICCLPSKTIFENLYMLSSEHARALPTELSNPLTGAKIIFLCFLSAA